MANSNVEKFIIELGFEDKEVLQGFKKFLKKYDDMNRRTVKAARDTQKKIVQAKQKQNKVELEHNKLLMQQNALRRKIVQAKNLGLDTGSEERSLSRAKKEQTLRKRTLQLEEKITKEKLAQARVPDSKKTSSKTGSLTKGESDKAAKERTGILEEEMRYAAFQERVRDQISFQEAQDKAYQKKLQQMERNDKQRTAATEKHRKKVSVNTQDQFKQAESLQKQKLEADRAEQARLDKALKEGQAKTDQERKDLENRAKQAKKRTEATIKQGKEIAKQKQQQIEAEKKAAESLDKQRRKADKERLDRLRKYEIALERLYNQSNFRKTERVSPDKASRLRESGDMLLRRAGSQGMTPDDVKELEKRYIRLTSSMRDVTSAVGRQSRAMVGLQTIQYGLRDSTRNLIRSYASLFALLMGTQAINTVGQDFQTMEASMLLASGTSAKAAEDLHFVREEARRLGLDLKDATDGFVKLKFAASGKLSNTEIEKLFTGYNEFATAIGVDKFRTEKGLQALQQIKVHCLPIQ